MYAAEYLSPLGRVTLASDGISIIGLWFVGQRYDGSNRLTADARERPEAITKAIRWLDEYFSGSVPAYMPPLNPAGTPFQRMVWDVLRTIPYGGTASYLQIAKAVAGKYHLTNVSARSVGGAVGRNPVSILIPCHRVIASNGALTGYAGGLHRKRWLLQLEQGNGVPEPPAATGTDYPQN